MSTGTEVALPGQSGELTSIDQLDPEEQRRIQLRRARRVLNGPQQQLAGLSRAEQLAECTRLIQQADEVREETLRAARERAAAAFFDAAGPYLRWVRDNDLYRDDDPRRTFEQWAYKTLGYKSSHTYLIMEAVEVRASLGVAGSGDYQIQGVTLNTGHVRALAPAIKASGADIAPKMWQQTFEREGKVTEAALRETWRLMASETSEESNETFESERLGAARRQVNETLAASVEQLDNLIERIAGLVSAGVAPADLEAAQKSVARIQAAGRWLRSDKVSVPEDIVLDAEIVGG
ncbi:hypothetical protein ACWF95_34155 [Streptomyces vinaceus]